MFYSHEIVGKKGALGILWILAHKKSISKRQIVNADLRDLCKGILESSVPFALRLQGILINGIVCVYERKQIYLLRDLQDMRKRLEAAEAAQHQGAAGNSKRAASAGRKRNVAQMKEGRDTAAFEAITLLDWDLALEAGSMGTPSGLLGERVADLASEMLELPSLDPTATTTIATDPSTAGGSRRRNAGSAGGSLAAALLGTGTGARGALPVAADDLLPLEEMDGNPEDELLALQQADEMFDVLPEVDLFDGGLDGLLPPPEADYGDQQDPVEQLDCGAPAPTRDADATPSASTDQQSSGKFARNDVKKPGGGGGAAAKSKKHAARKRIIVVVDPVNEMQISNVTYREWTKDTSGITIDRAARAAVVMATTGDGGNRDGAAELEGVVALLASKAGASLAFALMACAGPLGEPTLAAFRLCAGDGDAATATALRTGSGAAGDDPLVFAGGDLAVRAGGRRGVRASVTGEGKRAGDAARAAKRGRFGDLPLEQGDGIEFDAEEPLNFEDMAMSEHNDIVGDLVFADDVEMERLRAGAPTPGGSGDGAHQLLRGATPASSLDAGGNAFARALKRGAGGGKASGSDTSLLAPESALRSNLRGGRRGDGGRGSSGADLDDMLLEEGGSPLAHGGARRGTGGSLRNLLPGVEEVEDLAAPEGGSEPRHVLPSSQWQLLVESATQHPAHARDPEESMTAATHTAIRVFRSRLLDASRRGAGSSISFLGIAGRLSRGEAAKAFYQVLVTHANGYVHAGQQQAYGDISISAGAHM